MDWTDSLKINMRIDGLQEQIDSLNNNYNRDINNLEQRLAILEKKINKIEKNKTLVRKIHIRRIKKWFSVSIVNIVYLKFTKIRFTIIVLYFSLNVWEYGIIVIIINPYLNIMI